MQRLSTAYCAVLGNAAPAAPAAIESALSSALQTARSAWPGIHVDDIRFVTYLAERVDSEDPVGILSELLVGDLYIACACASGNAAAIDLFSKRYFANVEAVLAANGAGTFADDVRQILAERFFVANEANGLRPRILDYRGRGLLGAWVRVAAIRTGLSLQRERHGAEDDEALDELSSSVDPELDAIKLEHREAFHRALTDAFAILNDRDRGLLKLHYVEGVTVEKLAVMYGVHRVSASRWLSAARTMIMDETRRLLRERAGLSASQFDAVVPLLMSRVDLSIRRLLATRE